MSKTKNIAFIGLGTMGYPMAGHLSKNPNINLTVWNRSKNKSKNWINDFKGSVADSIKDSVCEADVIITCVSRDEDMQEIIYSDFGIYKNIKSNAVVIDHTTTSYNLATKIAKFLQERNVEFIDAPVSGGEIGAINGCLSVMAGGNKDTVDSCKSILNSYAKNITYIGDSGYGQLAKMVNQICIGGILQGLSDALLFAKNENINIERLLSAISNGAAQSWQMENRAITMNKGEFDFGFAIKWMVKDLGYCLGRAKDNQTDLSFTNSVYDKYQLLIKNGKGNLDTSALILQNQG